MYGWSGFELRGRFELVIWEGRFSMKGNDVEERGRNPIYSARRWTQIYTDMNIAADLSGILPTRSVDQARYERC